MKRMKKVDNEIQDELRAEYDLRSSRVRKVGPKRSGFRSFGQLAPHVKAQAYFWSAEWQQAEREAQADLDAGRSQRFDSVEDLIADLDSED
jgi:hypothetical protein